MKTKILNFNQFLTEKYEVKLYESLLLEGGAAGHMSHPFDNNDLTFGDFKNMIIGGLQGELNFESEPTEKCLSENTVVTLRNKGNVLIQEVVENKYEDDILSIDDNGDLIWVPIVDWFDNGKCNEWLLIELEDGKTIMTTPNHRIFVNGTDVKAETLKIGDELIID
jgi:intein/homing endonuclease